MGKNLWSSPQRTGSTDSDMGLLPVKIGTPQFFVRLVSPKENVRLEVGKQIMGDIEYQVERVEYQPESPCFHHFAPDFFSQSKKL